MRTSLPYQGIFERRKCMQELNATAHELTMHPLEAGQDVLIVIGEQVKKKRYEDI